MSLLCFLRRNFKDLLVEDILKALAGPGRLFSFVREDPFFLRLKLRIEVVVSPDPETVRQPPFDPAESLRELVCVEAVFLNDKIRHLVCQNNIH